MNQDVGPSDLFNERKAAGEMGSLCFSVFMCQACCSSWARNLVKVLLGSSWICVSDLCNEWALSLNWGSVVVAGVYASASLIKKALLTRTTYASQKGFFDKKGTNLLYLITAISGLPAWFYLMYQSISK